MGIAARQSGDSATVDSPTRSSSTSAGSDEHLPTPDRTGTIQQRLAYLFQTVVQPNGRPYPASAVARWISDNGDGQMSAVYLRKIMRGEREEPSSGYLRGIARFFEVDMSFFYDEAPATLDGRVLTHSSTANPGPDYPTPDRAGTIPQRVAYLFSTVVQADGRPYLAREVAEWIQDNGGQISTVYIQKIIRGEREEPSRGYLRWIAQFFEVSPSFFYDDAPAPVDGRTQNRLILMRSPDVLSVAQRYAKLPPKLRQAVSDLIDRLGEPETDGDRPAAADGE